MARRIRKRTRKGSVREREEERKLLPSQLAKLPRVTASRQKRWKKLRSLAKDDKFRDETRKIREALRTAYGHNPDAVREFFRRFWYPSPQRIAQARPFLEALGGAALRETMMNYLEYASRFGVYLEYWERHRKFRVRILHPRGAKFHVRVAEGHFEPISVLPRDPPFMDYFEDEGLLVLPELQKQIDLGAARYVEIADDSLSTVLSELEEFAYSPDAITFILHKAERPYLLCLVGEKVTQPEFRDAGKVVSALNRAHYGRGKGGRPRDRVRETKAAHKLQKPGSTKEKATDLSKGPSVKNHFSAQKYLREVKKRVSQQ